MNQIQKKKKYQNINEYEYNKINRMAFDKIIGEIDKNRRNILIDSIDLSIFVMNELDKFKKIWIYSNRMFNDLILFKKNTNNKIK